MRQKPKTKTYGKRYQEKQHSENRSGETGENQNPGDWENCYRQNSIGGTFREAVEAA